MTTSETDIVTIDNDSLKDLMCGDRVRIEYKSVAHEFIQTHFGSYGLFVSLDTGIARTRPQLVALYLGGTATITKKA